MNAENAGARDLDEAERAHQFDELVDLLARAGELEDEALVRGVDHVGAEDFRDAQALDALLARAGDLHQRQLALDAAGGIGDVDHLDDGHEAQQLLLDLFEHVVGAGRDDGDARLVRVAVDLGDRERFNVVAARGEQADDAGEDARLVVDDAGQRALLDAFVGMRHVVGGGGIVADAVLGGGAGAGGAGHQVSSFIVLAAADRINGLEHFGHELAAAVRSACRLLSRSGPGGAPDLSICA